MVRGSGPRQQTNASLPERAGAWVKAEEDEGRTAVTQTVLAGIVAFAASEKIDRAALVKLATKMLKDETVCQKFFDAVKLADGGPVNVREFVAKIDLLGNVPGAKRPAKRRA